MGRRQFVLCLGAGLRSANETVNDRDRLFALFPMADYHLHRFAVHQFFSVKLRQFVVRKLTPRPVSEVVAKTREAACEVEVVGFLQLELRSSGVFRVEFKPGSQELEIDSVFIFPSLDCDLGKDARVFPGSGDFFDF